MSGGRASDPAELLRRLRARGGGRAGTAEPSSSARAASAGALGVSTPGGPAAAHAPGAAAGPHTDSRAAALLRTAEDAAAALASPDPDLPRERAEIAAGLRAEASDPTRAGMVEVLPNGTRLHYCCECGRLASWGFDVAPDRGRDGTWYCFEHKERGR